MRALATIWKDPLSQATRGEPQQVTLLELVEAVGDYAQTEAEVVATVLHMLKSGRVKLRACFRDEPIDSLTN